MALATVEDVSVSLGRSLSDAEADQVEQWLNDAELQIRVRLGPIAGLDQEAVAFVEREAVVLKLRNPEGYASESVDDYTYRWGSSSGRVAILDDWWALLSPQESSAYSVRVGSPLDVP